MLKKIGIIIFLLVALWIGATISLGWYFSEKPAPGEPGRDLVNKYSVDGECGENSCNVQLVTEDKTSQEYTVKDEKTVQFNDREWEIVRDFDSVHIYTDVQGERTMIINYRLPPKS